MSNRSLIAFLCFFAFTFGFTSETLKVKLNHGGVLVGRHLESSEGRHIRAFLGIPYAKPPLDDLRFKSPQPYPSWKGEKLAIKDGPFCLQVDPYLRTSGPEGEEDCLYLNVYTPPLKDIKDPLPVIVWFHGGGWESGSGGELFYGPQFLLNRDVILVSGNYRLGPLGFLSTESLECPGNFGLKDQVEILRWVKENIHSFGGNASSITIAGESAGGATVSYLMHSEKSKGLFHKAILESGNFHNPWAQPMHEGEAFKRAMKLAKMFNCEESNKIIYCLRKVPGKDIIARFNEFFEWDIYPMIPFQPVVEVEHPEAFLTENPKETGLRSLDIPVLTGCNSGEGIIMSSFLLNNQEVMGELKSQVNKLFPIIFNYDHWSQDKQEEITKAIEGFYFKNGHVYEKETHQNFTGV
ncbi:CES5A.2 family protein, partial [Megaselia abdita]